MSSSKQSESAVVAIGSVAVVASIAAGLVAWRRRRKNRREVHFDVPSALIETEYAREVTLAVRLALEAGSNMVTHCTNVGTILHSDESIGKLDFKTSVEDFCTAVDLHNEEMITKAIQENFPSHTVIGEEATGTGALPVLTESPTWIIDPIDGTTNFASGLPLTCVSIGFVVDKLPIMGVVYAPMTRELYIAIRGHGAYRNGILLTNSPTTTTLRHAVVCFEFGYGRSMEAIQRMVGVVSRILQHGCRATRSLGSGVLDLCYVATGRIDVVYAGVANEGWKPWDYAAGLVMAVESGCAIESLLNDEEKELDIYANSVICAGNRKLLQETRKVILDGLY